MYRLGANSWTFGSSTLERWRSRLLKEFSIPALALGHDCMTLAANLPDVTNVDTPIGAGCKKLERMPEFRLE